MIVSRNAVASRTFAAIITVLVLIAPAGAQTNSPAERTSAAAQPRAEVTLSGTVDRLLRDSESAGPMGAHLLLRVAGGSVDAHLGPFFAQKDAAAITAGEAVEATGVWTKIHGREVLLVRQLRVGDRAVTVRNERGFPVREHCARRHRGGAESATHGGAQ